MSDHSSENSLAKGDSSGDIASKYTRLAMEYSKMRAQISVLKKTVLTEQAKNVNLNEILHSKDQTIRKLEQEIEALKFRNSQLSVRVSVLQDEISCQSTSNKKKNKKTEEASSVNKNHPLDDEVEKTMMEHARLIAEFSKKDEQYDAEIRTLRNEISSLNLELEQKNVKMRQLATDYQITVEQLKEEQIELKKIYASNVVKLKEVETQLLKLKTSDQSIVNGCNENDVNDIHSTSPTNYNDGLLALRKFYVNLLVAVRDVTRCNNMDIEGLDLNKTIILFDTYLNEHDIILFRNELKTYYHSLDNMKFSDNLQTTIQLFLLSCIQLLLSIETSPFEKPDLKYDSFANLMQLCHTRKNDLITKLNGSQNQGNTMNWNSEILDVAFDKFTALATDVDKQRARLRFSKQSSDSSNKSTDQTQSIALELPSNNTELEEYILLTNSLKEEIKILEETVKFLEQENVRFKAAESHLKEIGDLSKKVLADPSNKIAPIKNQLGSFLTPCMFSEEILAQTTRIQECLNEKLDVLVAEKQGALSKARNFMLESKSLQKRLEYARAEKDLLLMEHSSLKEMSDNLREELNTVCQNYEVQLSMMSEHVASVNEKLSTQSEEIINLHHQLNEKTSKKSKVK